ncbi:hypothetical protein GCM10025794_31150 [Massilia kyonggiensis]
MIGTISLPEDRDEAVVPTILNQSWTNAGEGEEFDLRNRLRLRDLDMIQYNTAKSSVLAVEVYNVTTK